MIVDYDESGRPITDDMYNHWSECADKLDFSEFKGDGEVINGLPTPIDLNDKTMISFEVPSSVAKDLSKMASKQNISRSNLLRSFVFEGMVRSNLTV